MGTRIKTYHYSSSSDCTWCGVGCLGAFVVMAVAWLTHIMWVIGKLAGPAGVTVGQIILALLGSFIPPVGVIHGIMIWFGHGF